MEVEPLEGDPDHLIVFRRTMRDALGYRPVHAVPKDKLEIIEEITEQDGGK